MLLDGESSIWVTCFLQDLLLIVFDLDEFLLWVIILGFCKIDGLLFCESFIGFRSNERRDDDYSLVR